MPTLLPVILTATHLVLTAQEVPQLNVEPSCHAAAGASIRHGRPNASTCLRNEQRARAKLKQQWNTFTGAERQRCVALSRLGGPPSYVELLTCLQVAKAAKNLPNDGE